jgi:hypothetical protein
MKACDLFAKMPRALAIEIVEFTFNDDKEIYGAVLEMVAQARKVRTIFLQRLPRRDRFAYIASALGRPSVEMAAENLIRNWLLKEKADLLADFLDALNIPHDKGVVENLPESVDDAVLQVTIEKLLDKYPHPVVAVYLNAFNHMNETRWPNLELYLECESRLELRPEDPIIRPPSSHSPPAH